MKGTITKLFGGTKKGRIDTGDDDEEMEELERTEKN